MKLTSFLSCMAAAALFGGLLAPDSQAQTRVRMDGKATGYTPPAGGATGSGPVRIREITGTGPRSLVRTPEFNSSVSRGRTPARDWAELAVQFDTQPEWIDELTVQYYALLYSRTSKEYTFLKGAVTHIDVARGHGHMTAAYIRPSTLQRYGEVVAVATEFLAKGAVAATDSIAGKLPDQQVLQGEWWKTIKLVPRDGCILNRAQTPFACVNYDDYEAIK